MYFYCKIHSIIKRYDILIFKMNVKKNYCNFNNDLERPGIKYFLYYTLLMYKKAICCYWNFPAVHFSIHWQCILIECLYKHA